MHILPNDLTILAAIEPLALAAGRRIMEIVSDGFRAEEKADCSPVTKADRDAETIILAGLRAHFPTIPVVAEEEASEGVAPQQVGRVFFLVDPLDGTREFVRGGDDFTENIALIRDQAPVVGVVYAPARNALYTGRPGLAEMARTDAAHEVVERRAIAVRARQTPPVIVATRSHNTSETDEFIARHQPAVHVTVGSSLKFCMVAAGEADIYPRFGRTMQWDTAAGDAVLRAAGGRTCLTDGTPFRYGRDMVAGDAPFTSPFFVAEGLPLRS